MNQYSICRSSWVWRNNQILSVSAHEEPSPVRYDIVLVLVRSSPEIAFIWSLSWLMAVGITWLYLLLTNEIRDGGGGGGGGSCGTRKELVGGVGQTGREEASWGEMTANKHVSDLDFQVPRPAHVVLLPWIRFIWNLRLVVHFRRSGKVGQGVIAAQVIDTPSSSYQLRFIFLVDHLNPRGVLITFKITFDSFD